MPNNILSILLILFSILLAFGKLDPIFSLESSVNTIDVVIVTFLVTFFITRFNDFLKSIFSKNFLYIFLIFFLFVFAQILNGYSELVKPLYNLKFVMCGVFFVSLISIFKKSPLTIHHCLIAFSVSSFIYSIFILFISPDLYQIVKGQMIVLDENPNSTSSRLAIAIIYILYFVIQNPLKWGRKRLVFLLLVPSLAAMVVMSGSRGSLLAVLLGAYLIFIFSDINKIKKIVLSIFSFFCSLFLFKFLLSSDDLGGRWEKALGGDTAGRTDIWEAVLKIAYAKPLGVGETGYVENITNLYGMYIDTHNIFLYILVCGGWLSLIFFIMFLISIFKNSFSCYMNDREILPLIFLFIMLFIAAKTGGVITFLLFWFILAVVASYRKI